MNELLASDYRELTGNDEALTAYLEWQSGNITDREALGILCAAIIQLDEQMKPLAERGAVLREQIGHVLAHYGQALDLPGFGKLEITNPSITKGYDRKQLDALIIELASEYPEVAAKLTQCRTESMRAGGLRIIREKQQQ